VFQVLPAMQIIEYVLKTKAWQWQGDVSGMPLSVRAACFAGDMPGVILPAGL
jgi:hypothetical protein